MISILLIVVIGVGLTLAYVGTQTNLFHSAPLPAAGYTTYSKYGFSFQYPNTWTITEKGMQDNAADSTSGIVVVQGSASQGDTLMVAWIHSVTSMDPSTVLSNAINGFQTGSGGTGLTMGMQSMMTMKMGYNVYYQPFSITVSGTHLNGVWAAWYSTQGQRLYQMGAVTSGDAMNMYNNCLASFAEQ